MIGSNFLVIISSYMIKFVSVARNFYGIFISEKRFLRIKLIYRCVTKQKQKQAERKASKNLMSHLFVCYVCVLLMFCRLSIFCFQKTDVNQL